MDGRSTIGVPNAPIALPNIPQGACSEAQATSEWCGRVAASARSGRRRILLKGVLVHRARVGAREAFGARAGLEGRLLGRAQTDRGEREPSPLGVDGSTRDGAWVGLCGTLTNTALTAKEILERLAGDRGTPSIGRVGAGKRRRVAVCSHSGRGWGRGGGEGK